VNFSERQADRVDGLLKFRFAKENKPNSFATQWSLSSLARGPEISYRAINPRLSSAFKSDRLLRPLKQS